MSKMRSRGSSKTDLKFQHLWRNQDSFSCPYLIPWVLLVERGKSAHGYSMPMIEPLKEKPLLDQGLFSRGMFQTASLRALSHLIALPWKSVLHTFLIQHRHKPYRQDLPANQLPLNFFKQYELLGKSGIHRNNHPASFSKLVLQGPGNI